MTDTTHEKALIIMAHGSRRAAANEEFFNLVKRIGSEMSGSAEKYSVVMPALLEQAPPTLLQVCQNLPDSVSDIHVYPLFFNQGRHVEKDIPAQVAEVMDALPEKTVELLNYFGQSEGLATLVLDHISEQSS
ncbi:sirohydrochlorin chelatase [Pseudomaricurvus sp.]|uniref:sirohydrochlorin chelatase n=1 Tax=Pseudomaricurvus sp. TaxID=2004510 RepID=UPI003F6B5CF5